MVLHHIPANSTAVGIPAKVVRYEKKASVIEIKDYNGVKKVIYNDMII